MDIRTPQYCFICKPVKNVYADVGIPSSHIQIELCSLHAQTKTMRAILAKLDVLSESFNLSTNKGRLAMSQAIDALGHETRDLLITIPE